MIDTWEGRDEGTPGVNVDELDVEAGVREASALGYDQSSMQMLADYCLTRWAKGEEELALRTAVHMGLDLTAWYRILAAARAGAYAGRHRQ